MRSRRWTWRAGVAVAAFLSIAAGRDEPRDYRRSDPDNPGGERLGADDGDDGFTGYPADVGDPDDPYYYYREEYAPYPPTWNGSYVGGGLLAGPLSLNSSELESTGSFSYGAFLNYSSVFQALDLQGSFRRAGASTAHDGLDLTLAHDQLAVSGLLHPFFIGLISGTRFGYTIAGIYGIGGLSLDWISMTGDAEESYRAIGWHLGAGLDFPIDSPQDGQAFWIGVQFRQDHVPGGQAEGFMRHRNMREDLLLIRLSYRHNGNLMPVNIPGPTYQ